MKITRNANIKRFTDLKVGEVFMHNAEYVLKVDEITCKEGDVVNAVFLNDGAHGTFYEKDIVTPVDCELIIN